MPFPPQFPTTNSGQGMPKTPFQPNNQFPLNLNATYSGPGVNPPPGGGGGNPNNHLPPWTPPAPGGHPGQTDPPQWPPTPGMVPPPGGTTGGGGAHVPGQPWTAQSWLQHLQNSNLNMGGDPATQAAYQAWIAAGNSPGSWGTQGIQQWRSNNPHLWAGQSGTGAWQGQGPSPWDPNNPINANYHHVGWGGTPFAPPPGGGGAGGGGKPPGGGLPPPPGGGGGAGGHFINRGDGKGNVWVPDPPPGGGGGGGYFGIGGPGSSG